MPTGSNSDCDFCRIALGLDAEVEIIQQDEQWVAFFPLDPATPGHTLIIPRTHVEDLWEATPALASELMRAVHLLGQAIQSSLRTEGMNVISSAGAAAEQTVFHLHLHVVPRWRADGFGHIWPQEGVSYSDDQLENVGDMIRERLAEG